MLYVLFLNCDSSLLAPLMAVFRTLIFVVKCYFAIFALFLLGVKEGVTLVVSEQVGLSDQVVVVLLSLLGDSFVVMARLCVINLGCHLVESAGICVILLLSLQYDNCVLSLWCVSCRLSAVLD